MHTTFAKIAIASALAMLPAFAFADTSVIYSNVSADASSGSQRASSGQRVSSGNSSASSEVHTTVNATDSGGVYTNTIDTEVNGVHHTESVTRQIPADATVTAEIATSTEEISKTSSAHAYAKLHWFQRAKTGSTIGIFSSTSAAANPASLFKGHVMQSLNHFLNSIFSFFFGQ